MLQKNFHCIQYIHVAYVRTYTVDMFVSYKLDLYRVYMHMIRISSSLFHLCGH